jgi:hypothetical protein
MGNLHGLRFAFRRHAPNGGGGKADDLMTHNWRVSGQFSVEHAEQASDGSSSEWLFAIVPLDPGELHLHIRAFDDPSCLAPTGEAFADERLPWLHLTT